MHKTFFIRKNFNIKIHNITNINIKYIKIYEKNMYLKHSKSNIYNRIYGLKLHMIYLVKFFFFE